MSRRRRMLPVLLLLTAVPAAASRSGGMLPIFAGLLGGVAWAVTLAAVLAARRRPGAGGGLLWSLAALFGALGAGSFFVAFSDLRSAADFKAVLLFYAAGAAFAAVMGGAAWGLWRYTAPRSPATSSGLPAAAAPLTPGTLLLRLLKFIVLVALLAVAGLCLLIIRA